MWKWEVGKNVRRCSWRHKQHPDHKGLIKPVLENLVCEIEIIKGGKENATAVNNHEESCKIQIQTLVLANVFRK